MNRKVELLDYQNSIRAPAMPEHLELVKQVYGER
jgi:hypothetical protein